MTPDLYRNYIIRDFPNNGAIEAHSEGLFTHRTITIMLTITIKFKKKKNSNSINISIFRMIFWKQFLE